MTPRRRFFASLLSITVAVATSAGWIGCAETVAAEQAGPAEASVTPSKDAQAPSACAGREQIPLRRVDSQGYPSSTYVDTRWSGRDGVLHFDTASDRSLIVADGDAGFVSHIGEVPLGCRSWPTGAYYGPFGALPDVDGRPVLGSAGAHLLRGEPSLFDVRGSMWTRNPNARDLVAIEDAVAPVHAWEEGTMVLEAKLDGTPVRLVIDTGAGHSLWIGQQPQPGDVEVVTEDYLGRELRLWQTELEVTIGEKKRRLPVLRAPSFPGVQEDFARRNIQGLLGLSAIDALFVDERARVLKISMRRE